MSVAYAGKNWQLSWEFVLRDFWIGVFWKSLYSIGYEADVRYAKPFRKSGTLAERTNFDLYVCFVPCFPIHFKWWRRP